MNALQPWHIIILVIVLIVLFGAKRLPDAARSVGKSMKIFKAETKGMRQEDDSTTTEADAKQLPASSASTDKDPKDQQVADLQRQLDELKKEQSPSTDGAQKNAS